MIGHRPAHNHEAGDVGLVFTPAWVVSGRGLDHHRPWPGWHIANGPIRVVDQKRTERFRAQQIERRPVVRNLRYLLRDLKPECPNALRL